MSPREAWLLTFAELFAMFEHQTTNDVKKQKELYRVMDNLNAMNCFVQSRCAGSDRSELENFKVYREEIEVSEVEKSPEQISNIIKMMAGAGVLKPEGGD